MLHNATTGQAMWPITVQEGKTVQETISEFTHMSKTTWKNDRLFSYVGSDGITYHRILVELKE